MNKTSIRIRIASALLLAAYAFGAWLHFRQWEFALQNAAFERLTNFSGDYWLADFLYFPQALFLPFTALAGGILGLVLKRRWIVSAGAASYLALLPIGFIADLTYFVLLEHPDALAEALKWQMPTQPQGYLFYVGVLLAITALLIAVFAKANAGTDSSAVVTSDSLPSVPLPVEVQQNFAPSESPIPAVKPVAYDTQTGRPILRYDTRTGQPIYADEPGATQ